MEKTLKAEMVKAMEEAKDHIEEAVKMPLTADGIEALQRRIDATQSTLSWVRQTVERLRNE